MRLRDKILVGYLAMVLLLVAMGALGLASMRLVQYEFEAAVGRTYPVIEALQHLRLHANRVTLGIAGSSPVLPDTDSTAGLEELQSTANRYHALVRRLFPEERELAGRIRLESEALAADLRMLIEGGRSLAADESQRLRENSHRHLASLERLVDEALAGERVELNEYQEEVLSHATMARLRLTALGAGAVLVALAGGWWLTRRISRPVERLRQITEEVGRGHFDARVGDGNRDEIGALAKSFDQMTSELAETVVSRDDLEAIIEAISDGLLVVSPEGVIERANSAMRMMCQGSIEGPLAGHRVDEVFECGVGRNRLLGDYFLREGFECTIRSKDDPPHRVAITATMIRGDGGKRGWVMLVRDRRGRSPALGAGHARQLAGPEAAKAHLATRLSVLEWRGRNVGVLVVGLERCAELQRSLGQQVCEGLVARIAERIRTVLRPDDAVARWSDESLVVVLEDVASPCDMASIGDTLVAALDEPFMVGAHEVRLTVSVGMACAPDHGLQPEALLACAETALRCVRADGKRRCMMYAQAGGRGSTDRVRSGR
ncbi:MAG: diguanylate cyclase [Zoogloeaceae bacterium]|nr:diguanylate cyclase [Rhodocyclaceae bacterium]MCP5237601.1 diguanylate cyclase [Zoogloeaceae bacterium]